MIVLAAGQGTRLRPLTDVRPKCLVPLGGKPLLEWQLQAAREAGIDDVVVVGGYLAEQLTRPGIHVVVNADHSRTNMVESLFCAEAFFGDQFVMSYGDIVYAPSVVKALLADDAPVSVVVDQAWRPYWQLRFRDILDDAESLRTDGNGRILSIGQRESDAARIEAQYIGLVAFRRDGVEALRHCHARAKESDRLGQSPFGSGRTAAGLYMTDLLQGMIDHGFPLRAVRISGGWCEVDSFHDLEVAEGLLSAGALDGEW